MSGVVAIQEPTGCPADDCGGKPVKDLLQKAKITATEVPRPRHAWSDIHPCKECGRCWLLHKEAQ